MPSCCYLHHKYSLHVQGNNTKKKDDMDYLMIDQNFLSAFPMYSLPCCYLVCNTSVMQHRESPETGMMAKRQIVVHYSELLPLMHIPFPLHPTLFFFLIYCS